MTVNASEKLDFGHKQLLEWPSSAIAGVRGGPAAIHTLNLSGNHLSSIPGDRLAQLVNLEEMNISHNQLKSLPPEIGCLTKLRYLRANCNYISSVPREIGNLKCLQHLFLENNSLTSLPVEIGLIPDLSSFYVVSCGDIRGEGQQVWPVNVLQNLPPNNTAILTHLRTLAAAQPSPPSDLIETTANDALAALCSLHDACLRGGGASFEGLPAPDVALAVEHGGARESLPAHSFLLQLHSAHFRRVLGAGMRESRTREIPVTEYGPGTVRALLRYLYTGERDVDVGGAGDGDPSPALLELLRAAHYYELPRLAQHVEGRLCLPGFLGAAAALRALVAADQLGRPRLREAALAAVWEQGPAVVRTAEYRELAATGQADLLVEVGEALARR